MTNRRTLNNSPATPRFRQAELLLRSGTDNYLAHINTGRRRPIKLATLEILLMGQTLEHYA